MKWQQKIVEHKTQLKLYVSLDRKKKVREVCDWTLDIAINKNKNCHSLKTIINPTMFLMHVEQVGKIKTNHWALFN